MSRIHEALKKAAQERSAKLGTGDAEAGFVELAEAPRAPLPSREAEEVAGPPMMPPTAQSAPLARVADDLSYLRYDELVQRCCRPYWKIDPRLSVFESGDD